jgi:hypothetical protein
MNILKKSIFVFCLLIILTTSIKAQVGIGTNSPNESSKLEINATNKGVLIPRLTLTGSTDATTIATPATSLLVYNTATTSDVVPGYYYNSGTSGSPVWIRLNTNSLVTGANSGETINWNSSTLQWQITGTSGLALGNRAGYYNQGNSAIALGYYAGYSNQGANAIALGNQAGIYNQASNSIVLNASGVNLDASTIGTFISPVRSTSNTENVLTYNVMTKEMSYTSAKTFVIDHPTQTDSYLVHACLEGPEAGVYYRGESKIENNQSVVIKLPDYVSSFATNFSINITPIYSDDSDENIVYRTSRVKDNAFTVHGKNGSFYWIVYGQRGKVDVEPKKSEVQVSGDGPYKYIKPGK